MHESDVLYDRLRRLAVEDPREAKRVFLEAFESNSSGLEGFLARLQRPNEGRLRQVVANAIRTHPEKRRVVSHLFRWRETETDEFTRRAIDGALVDVELTAGRGWTEQQASGGPSEVADVYRYVAGRLRHRLRNTMLAAQAQANRLRKMIPAGVTAEFQTVIAKLDDAMVAMGRELEATDVDPEFFRQRSVALGDWLKQMNVRYATQYNAIALRLVDDSDGIRVFANDYLLETVFWNVWLNAHQAVGPGCEIFIDFKTKDGHVELQILDNGEGFSSDLKDVVFQQVYSSWSGNRGRGLLEIQDAVEQLGGSIQLYESRPLQYRILIRLPLDLQ